MKRLSFRFTSFFLCFLIIFTIVFCDYKKVFAFEWAVPTVTWDIAAPVLFGLLGVAYVGSSDSFWDNSEDEFLDYAQTEGYTGPNIRKWLSDVYSGTLNQASEIWTCFKSWVQSKSESLTPVANNTVGSLLHTLYPNLTSISFSDSVFSESSTPSYGIYYVNGSKTYCAFFSSDYVFSYTNSSIKFTNTGSGSTIGINANTNISALSFITSTAAASYTLNSSYEYYVFGVSDLPTSIFSNLHTWDIPVDYISEFLAAAGVAISDLALMLSDAISTSIPDVITLPWDKVGDTTDAISKVIEGLIELVQEGVLDISDYMAKIQDLLGVLVIDPTADIVIPETTNPDTGEPTTPEDIVNDNISNSGFILTGLEKVFPFCLPYDLYNFVTLLVAEPVAPEIHYPIYDPTTGETLTIDIDFEEWESIVILFRYIFDFLFIIGLNLIARALIGGGDKA